MEFSAESIAKYVDIVTAYAAEYTLNIIGAIAIFIVGKWVAKRITGLIKSAMERADVDKTLIEFAESVIFALLMVVVILAALNTLGVQTTSVIAILGAAGLAVGLALQGTLANVGAAVLIILFRPFKVGDFVTAGGETGTVAEINLFSTTLSPVDNRTIIIPNGKIIGNTIVNFSAKETRRVDLVFGIGYGDDLKLAKETLYEILRADERILDDPEPFVAVSELGDSSVNFITRAWVKSDDYWGVHFDTIEKVKLTFDEKGISIPYPQMDVHLDKPE
jgi:small conductance mechanosensitive channel